MSSLFINHGLKDIDKQNSEVTNEITNRLADTHLEQYSVTNETMNMVADTHLEQHSVTNETMNMVADTHLEQHSADEIMNDIADTPSQQIKAVRHYSHVVSYPKELTPLLWRDLTVEVLKCYNKRNRGAEMKIFGEVKAVTLFAGGTCGFHLYFQAQDNMDSSPKTIFAEVFRPEESKESKEYEEGRIIVTYCDVMDPSNPNVRNGCEFCNWEKLHPKNMELWNFPPSRAFSKRATTS